METGCRAAKHIDKETPGIMENLARIQRIAERHSSKVLYRQCDTCRDDLEVTKDGYKFDGLGPREDGRWLCDNCEEEEEKVNTNCHHCGGDMRVHPDYWGAGEEILCEACEEVFEQIEYEKGLGPWQG